MREEIVSVTAYSADKWFRTDNICLVTGLVYVLRRSCPALLLDCS